jgi:hypothetical protein
MVIQPATEVPSLLLPREKKSTVAIGSMVLQQGKTFSQMGRAFGDGWYIEPAGLGLDSGCSISKWRVCATSDGLPSIRTAIPGMEACLCARWWRGLSALGNSSSGRKRKRDLEDLSRSTEYEVPPPALPRPTTGETW